MKTTVVYHAADFDGIFCREIARKFLGDEDVQYIGWNFGDPPLALDTKTLYVMDLPCDRPFGVNLKDLRLVQDSKSHGFRMRDTTAQNLIWIDHHKSSIESHPTDIPGYRIDGVAACRLAWQWFSIMHDPNVPHGLPSKQDFTDRGVSEPLAVRLAGEYDIWDHRGDGDWEFQFGLRCEEELNWTMLLNQYSERYTLDVIERGRIAMRYSQNVDAGIVRDKGFLVEWEGLKFLALNHARFNSLTFDARDVPETGHDALIGFSFDGKKWMVSLYHAKHRKDLDLSPIAVKHGGGGHKGACGFVCEKLPFLP